MPDPTRLRAEFRRVGITWEWPDDVYPPPPPWMAGPVDLVVSVLAWRPTSGRVTLRPGGPLHSLLTVDRVDDMVVKAAAMAITNDMAFHDPTYEQVLNETALHALSTFMVIEPWARRMAIDLAVEQVWGPQGPPTDPRGR